MKPRGILIAGNWKMNLGPKQATEYFSTLRHAWIQKLSNSSRNAIKSGQLSACIFPPAVSLAPCLQARSDLPVEIGAQNAHWEKSGAFTGELSAPLLQEIGVKTVLVGHSERRQYFGETDESVKKRAEGLLAQGMKVVLCIGETRAEREGGKTQAVLERQLSQGLPSEPASFLDRRLILAYEPVWAIGTGLTASPEQAEEAHQMIRKFLWDRYGMEPSGRTPILYGGSVTPENVRALLGCPNIDGGLVGGASLKPEQFLAMLEAGGGLLN